MSKTVGMHKKRIYSISVSWTILSYTEGLSL